MLLVVCMFFLSSNELNFENSTDFEIKYIQSVLELMSKAFGG